MHELAHQNHLEHLEAQTWLLFPEVCNLIGLGWIWALFFFRSTPDDSNEYSVLRTLIQLKEKCYYFEGFQAKTGREQCIPQCPVPNFRGSLQIWMQHTFAYVCGSRAFGGWLLVFPLLKKKKKRQANKQKPSENLLVSVYVFEKVHVWCWGEEWTKQGTTFLSSQSESWCQHLQQVHLVSLLYVKPCPRYFSYIMSLSRYGNWGS